MDNNNLDNSLDNNSFLRRKKKIGFMLALLVSLIFSPLIGIICVALSERKSNDNGRNNSSEKTNKGFDIEQFRKN